METGFWFNRLIEYWTLPTVDQVVDHVRGAWLPYTSGIEAQIRGALGGLWAT